MDGWHHWASLYSWSPSCRRVAFAPDCERFSGGVTDWRDLEQAFRFSTFLARGRFDQRHQLPKWVRLAWNRLPSRKACFFFFAGVSRSDSMSLSRHHGLIGTRPDRRSMAIALSTTSAESMRYSEMPIRLQDPSSRLEDEFRLGPLVMESVSPTWVSLARRVLMEIWICTDGPWWRCRLFTLSEALPQVKLELCSDSPSTLLRGEEIMLKGIKGSATSLQKWLFSSGSTSNSQIDLPFLAIFSFLLVLVAINITVQYPIYPTKHTFSLSSHKSSTPILTNLFVLATEDQLSSILLTFKKPTNSIWFNWSLRSRWSRSHTAISHLSPYFQTSLHLTKFTMKLSSVAISASALAMTASAAIVPIHANSILGTAHSESHDHRDHNAKASNINLDPVSSVAGTKLRKREVRRSRIRWGTNFSQYPFISLTDFFLAHF